jgi:hypothetical protein
VDALVSEIPSNLTAIVQELDSEAMARNVGLLLDWSIGEIRSQEIQTSLRVLDEGHLSENGSISRQEQARNRLKHDRVTNNRRKSIQGFDEIAFRYRYAEIRCELPCPLFIEGDV